MRRYLRPKATPQKGFSSYPALKALTLAIVLLFALIAGCDSGPDVVVMENIAPEFSLKDIEGRTVRLSDFKGKFVVLEFWATWCPPCQAAVPELNDFQAAILGKDIVLLSITMDNSLETVKEFARDYQVTYPILMDDGTSRAYRAYTIPTTIVVGRDGLIFKRHVGYAPGQYERLLNDLVAEMGRPATPAGK